LQGQLQYLPDDPNRLMLNEKSNIDVNQRQLSKEREEERILNQLRSEFSRIDVSSDGLVTFDELKGVLGGRTEVAEQIFQEIDVDNSGAVSLQEFVETYFVKQRLVKERLAELELGLKAHHKSRE
jgi:Ca2+-binding EF-hand superfamily protein